MTPLEHILFTVGVGAGVALVVIGFGGILLRRSVLVVVMSGAVSMLGAALTLVLLSASRGDARGVAVSMFIVLLAAVWSLAGAAVALATYRRRGTENLDELRELRG